VKKIVYMLVGTVFLGANLLAIDIGIAQISLYRLMLGFITLFLIYKAFTDHTFFSLNFNRNENQYKNVYILWLIVSIISVIWARDITGWIRGTFFVGTGTLSIIYITSFIKEKRSLKTLFAIVYAMVGFQQLYGWYQVLALGDSTPNTTFANTNDYSTLMLAGIAIAFIHLLNSNDVKVKIVSLISMFSGYLLISIAGSRANMLALYIFVGAIIGMKILEKYIVRKAFMIGLFILVAGILTYFIFPGVRAYVYDSIATFIAGGGSNVYRINMILNGFVFLARTFGIGVGAGNVEHWMVNTPVFEVNAPNIHNWFMDILVGYGLIVFIAYIVMYVFILRQLFVSYRYSTDIFVRNTSMIMFAYVLCFTVSSMSSASNIFIEWQWVFWGVIIAYVQYAERADSFRVPSNKLNLERI